MPTKIRALILEDNLADVRLLVHELKQAGFEPSWNRVESEPDYLRELNSPFDIIFSDFSMPQFDAMRALHLLQESGLDIPFIIVSGTIGEEVAVQAIQRGATDYLLKDRLARLGQAVTRALEHRKLLEDRRRTEEQLRLQASALAAAGNGIVLTNRQGTILWVNPAFTQITGYTREEALGKNTRFLKSGKHDKSFFENLWQTILAGKIWSGEMINRRKDGSLYFEEQTITPVRNEQGEISHFIAIKLDATDRKRIEESLRESNQNLRTLIQASPLAIMTLNLQGHVVEWNPAAERTFGWKKEEVLGRPLPYVPPDKRKEFDQILREELQGRALSGFETYRLRKDGSRVELRLFTAPLYDAENQIVGTIGLVEDITETKRLEEQFRQSQKLEAIGRLAGGVAHDFNNLLTVINGYSELVLSKLQHEDPLWNLIEQISAAGQRAATLTRQLLAFSRKQVLLVSIVDLNHLLAEMEKMLGRVIGEDIELKVIPQEGLWKVKADPGQVEQIVMNLVVNSRDAMPQGGKLTIETHNVELDESYAKIYPAFSPGQYVLLAVSDTGQGMDKTTQARIFEPFFTTKGEKGTGLGLATVYGIVKQSGGNIDVYSEPGIGTSFKIYLPRERETISSGRVSTVLKSTGQGSETVLLVEDEEGVRALTRLVLQQNGYKVLEARHGDEALALSQQYQETIHIMVSDVVMPKISGLQLAKLLAGQRPEMKVLFFSGYTDEAIVHHGILDETVPFLHKPFSPDALARKVREVLDN